MEEQAHASSRTRASSGLALIAVGVWAGEPRLWSGSAKSIEGLHQPTSCVGVNIIIGYKESNGIKLGWVKRKKKGEAILPSPPGHGTTHASGRTLSSVCKESGEDLGLVSLERR